MNDIAILRDLGKQYAEIAAGDENKEHERRVRDMHSLRLVKPPLWFGQIPWHELSGAEELRLACEDPGARNIEWGFRTRLFQWKYFRGDLVLEPCFVIGKSYSESSIGISIKEETRATDARNNIISHHFEDQLDTEDKVDAVVLPVITPHPETDRRNVAYWTEVFDGILPVTLRGTGIYFQPWDIIARFRGVEPCLVDMIDRPELIHRTMRKFTDVYIARYEQLEALGLLAHDAPEMNCTPTWCDELPAPDYDGRDRLKDVWWCGTAQLFVSASPEMNWEFNLQYLKPFIERCRLAYYGCCEPLDRVIPYLRRIANLRKIGASPWTNLRSQAEQMGADYVLSRKPNPALVAGALDEEAIKREIRETIEICRANRTPFEYVLKDISTVGYRLSNLVEWTRLVTGVIDSCSW